MGWDGLGNLCVFYVWGCLLDQIRSLGHTHTWWLVIYELRKDDNQTREWKPESQEFYLTYTWVEVCMVYGLLKSKRTTTICVFQREERVTRYFFFLVRLEKKNPKVSSHDFCLFPVPTVSSYFLLPFPLQYTSSQTSLGGKVNFLRNTVP